MLIDNTFRLDCLSATSRSIQQYELANEHRALEMDGNEQISICNTLLARTAILMQQLRPICRWHTDTVEKTVVCVQFFQIFYAVVPTSWQLPTRIQKLRCIQWMQLGVQHLSHLFVVVLNKSDRLLLIASSASYVALCLLGAPIHGVLGGLSLVLIALKRQKILDSRVHHLLLWVSNVSWLLHNLFQPSFWLYRACNVIVSSSNLWSLAVSNRSFSDVLPPWIRNPYYNLHVKQEITPDAYAIFKNNQDEEEFFFIEKSYVHANQVMEVFSPEPERSPAIVFQELDAAITRWERENPEWKKRWNEPQKQIAEDGITQVSGYDQLKTAALTGKIGDYTPPNSQPLRNLLTQMAESILIANPENARGKLEELEKIGKQCSQRWAMDIQVLVSPHTKDVAWGVHHVLSKMRGAELTWATSQILNAQYFDSVLAYEVQKIRAITGNQLQIHMLNALHNGYKYWFPTYEGMVDTQLHLYSLLEALTRRYLLPHTPLPRSRLLFQIFLESLSIQLRHDLFINKIFFVRELHDRLMQHFDKPDRLVKQVHAAILQRTIMWDTSDGAGGIQHWIQQFCEKMEEDAGVFYPLYTEQVGGQQCLNFKGVQLLLWDLGILQPLA